MKYIGNEMKCPEFRVPFHHLINTYEPNPRNGSTFDLITIKTHNIPMIFELTEDTDTEQNIHTMVTNV